MKRQAIVLFAAGLLTSGCASADGAAFAGDRTVFANPYVEPVIDRTGIGPGCLPERAREPACTIDVLIAPRNGRLVAVGNGQTVRLTRAERRELRERSEAIAARRELFEALQNTPPSIPPTAPPTSGDTPSSR